MNHSTLAISNPTQKLSAFASTSPARAHTIAIPKVTNPSGTIIPVSNTAGILLTGPAKLTR